MREYVISHQSPKKNFWPESHFGKELLNCNTTNNGVISERHACFSSTQDMPKKNHDELHRRVTNSSQYEVGRLKESTLNVRNVAGSEDSQSDSLLSYDRKLYAPNNSVTTDAMRYISEQIGFGLVAFGNYMRG